MFIRFYYPLLECLCTGVKMNQKIKILARDEGRDVWEIEMTGGSIEENSSALDYTYQNLVEDYWSVLLGAVQYYTGKITVDYVGHSNGCRVALSSLKNYQTTGKSNVAIVQNLMTGNNVNVNLQGAGGAHVVNTFVGVACPGAFEGDSYLIEQVNQHPNSVAQLQARQNWHPDRDDIIRRLSSAGLIGQLFVSAGKPISLNLWSHYNDAILLSNDTQPGNFNVNRSKIFYGYGGLNGWGNEQEDGMVTVGDNLAIADNINSNNGDDREGQEASHQGIADKRIIKQKIMVFLLNDN